MSMLTGTQDAKAFWCTPDNAFTPKFIGLNKLGSPLSLDSPKYFDYISILCMICTNRLTFAMIL